MEKSPDYSTSKSARNRPSNRDYDETTSSFDDMALLNANGNGASPSRRGGGAPTSKLDSLEMRHNTERDEVERIRRELGM